MQRLQLFLEISTTLARQAHLIALCRFDESSSTCMDMDWRISIILTYFTLLSISRGEQLLIYVASDHLKSIRSVATEVLSQYGRVVLDIVDDELQ